MPSPLLTTRGGTRDRCLGRGRDGQLPRLVLLHPPRQAHAHPPAGRRVRTWSCCSRPRCSSRPRSSRSSPRTTLARPSSGWRLPAALHVSSPHSPWHTPTASDTFQPPPPHLIPRRHTDGRCASTASRAPGTTRPRRPRPSTTCRRYHAPPPRRARRDAGAVSRHLPPNSRHSPAFTASRSCARRAGLGARRRRQPQVPNVVRNLTARHVVMIEVRPALFGGLSLDDKALGLVEAGLEDVQPLDIAARGRARASSSATASPRAFRAAHARARRAQEPHRPRAPPQARRRRRGRRAARPRRDGGAAEAARCPRPRQRRGRPPAAAAAAAATTAVDSHGAAAARAEAGAPARYHVFLSHQWRLGQDVTRVIQLRLTDSRRASPSSSTRTLPKVCTSRHLRPLSHLLAPSLTVSRVCAVSLDADAPRPTRTRRSTPPPRRLLRRRRLLRAPSACASCCAPCG